MNESDRFFLFPEDPIPDRHLSNDLPNQQPLVIPSKEIKEEAKNDASSKIVAIKGVDLIPNKNPYPYLPKEKPQIKRL